MHLALKQAGPNDNQYGVLLLQLSFILLLIFLKKLFTLIAMVSATPFSSLAAWNPVAVPLLVRRS